MTVLSMKQGVAKNYGDYGTPGVIEYVDVPQPEGLVEPSKLKAENIVIRIKAAGLNRVDGLMGAGNQWPLCRAPFTPASDV